MKKCSVALLLTIAIGIPATAIAEVTASVGDIKVTPFSVTGLEVSKSYSIDKTYGEKHGREIPAPFQFALPVMDGVKPYFETPTEGDSTYLKISFATEEKQLIENIRFIPFQVEMVEKQKRIHTTANLLANQGFELATKSYKDVKRLAVVQSEIGGHDAAVVVGQYTDPSIGLMYVRLVGIINPHNKHSILIFANFNPKLSAANAPDKLHKAGITYKVIESLKYSEQGRSTAPAPLADVAWSMTFSDGSGNVYSFISKAGDSGTTFSYTPVTAARSSSGVYSGGKPASGTLTADQAAELRQWMETLKTDTKSHTDRRMMGTGSLRLVTGGTETAFLVKNSEKLRDFNRFLETLRLRP